MSFAKQPVAIPVDQPAVLGTSVRVRLQLTRKQEFTLSHWMFAAHRLRNTMALWLAKRRRVRAIWLRVRPNRPLPKDLTKNDAVAASRRLTQMLATARAQVRLALGLTGGRNTIGEEALAALWHASRGERAELRDLVTHDWLLGVPRDLLEQVMQDLKRTLDKAFQDRRARKADPKSWGKKPVAGFPHPRRWRFAGSVRRQVVAGKNAAFRTGWAAGLIDLPVLGRLTFRHGLPVAFRAPSADYTLAQCRGRMVRQLSVPGTESTQAASASSRPQ